MPPRGEADSLIWLLGIAMNGPPTPAGNVALMIRDMEDAGCGRPGGLVGRPARPLAVCGASALVHPCKSIGILLAVVARRQHARAACYPAACERRLSLISRLRAPYPLTERDRLLLIFCWLRGQHTNIVADKPDPMAVPRSRGHARQTSGRFPARPQPEP